jgi:hypothetical protein
VFAGYADGMKKWKQHAQALSNTLGWCQVLLQQADPTKKLDSCIVFPLEGVSIRMG